jgi:hypothetical protein
MYSSSFAGSATHRRYRPSFAVRVRPGPGRSRAAVGPNNRDLHSEMLLTYGRKIDDERFEEAVGSTYLDVYRLLLARATDLGRSLPPLVVTGNAIPDLRLDETPTVCLMGEFEGPATSFAVVEETSLAAVLSVHSATITARSKGYDAFLVLLADRADLVYSSEFDDHPAEEIGILLHFEHVDGLEGGAPDRVQWRSGLASREAVVAAADELASTSASTIVIPAALAERWNGCGDRTLVAPANQPATGLVDVAMTLPSGSEPLLIGFDPARGQLAALSFRVPEASL